MKIIPSSHVLVYCITHGFHVCSLGMLGAAADSSSSKTRLCTEIFLLTFPENIKYYE